MRKLTVTGDFPGKTSMAGRGSGSIPNSNSQVDNSPTGHRIAINSRTESRSSVEVCVNSKRPGTGPTASKETNRRSKDLYCDCFYPTWKPDEIQPLQHYFGEEEY
jgi:hypothetical protein